MIRPQRTIPASWRLRLCALGIILTASGCAARETPDNRFIVIPDDNASAVNVRVIFGIGENNIPAGTAWMTAQALSGPYSEAGGRDLTRLRSLGATIEASAGREALVIDISCPKSNWSQVAQLVAQHLTSPTFAGLKIDELRLRQHAALDSLRHDPEGLTRAVLWAATYDGTQLAAPPMGTDSSIEAITADDLETFQSQFITNGNYHLGMAGPIRKEEASTFDSHLQESLPSGGPAKATPAGRGPSGLNVRIVELRGLQRASILVGRATDHLSEDTAASVLAMAAALHGVPGASLLGMDQFLRVERGLVEGVDVETSLIQSTRDGVTLRSSDPSRRDCFFVSVQPDPLNALFAARIIIKELTDLNSAGLSQEDIGAMHKLILQLDHPTDDATLRMREALARKWVGVNEISETKGEGALLVTSSRSRQLIRAAFDPRDLWVIAVVPDAQRFLAEVLSGMTTYQYPPWVDLREIRHLDQEYVSFRPFWQAEKIRSLKTGELFR